VGLAVKCPEILAILGHRFEALADTLAISVLNDQEKSFVDVSLKLP
jgi:hypothetical protein